MKYKFIDSISGPIEEAEGSRMATQEELSSLRPPQYPLGTRVKWLGCEGTVTGDGSAWHKWIEVRFDNNREVMFTMDGYYAPGFCDGQLEIIGKVPVMVKKHIYVYKKNGAVRITRHLDEDTARTLLGTDPDVTNYLQLPWTLTEEVVDA